MWTCLPVGAFGPRSAVSDATLLSMTSEESAEEEAPWRREREALSEASVRGIVQARFPDVACRDVQVAGEGWDFEVWRVDDWAFRFPKRAQWAVQQRREIELLRVLAPRLPVAIPNPCWVGESAEDFPFSFAGYRWLEGLGGDRCMPATVRWGDFAQRYGGLLKSLHGTPAGAVPQGVRRGGEPIENRLREFESEVRDVLSPEGFERAWRAALDPAVDRSWPHEPVLIHGDLCPEHWLFDEDGCLAAVIDWTDARWGDPVGDFTGLWIWFGEDVLRRALAAYGSIPVPDFVERVRTRGIALVMIWIGEWVRWSSSPPICDRAAALIPRFLDLLPDA